MSRTMVKERCEKLAYAIEAGRAQPTPQPTQGGVTIRIIADSATGEPILARAEPTPQPTGDTPTAESLARELVARFFSDDPDEGDVRDLATQHFTAAITAAEERGYQRAICQRSRLDHEAGRQAGIREVARETADD